MVAGVSRQQCIWLIGCSDKAVQSIRVPLSSSTAGQQHALCFSKVGMQDSEVTLLAGTYHMFGASLGLLAGVTAKGFRSGLAHPTEENM
jgi:hypothetical protein